MGWVYGFHSLDPRIVGELTSASKADLVARLKAKGISPEDAGCDSWEDELDENTVLSILATTREWDVEKSLAAIEQLTALDPALAPVRRLLREMEDFSASGLPERFHATEVGLMGIAMPETIAAALVAAEPFAGVEGRRALATPSSWMNRLFAGVRKQIAADDFLWQRWTALIEAMRWAHSRGEWLGLGMG
jgi:hypothetical protein